MKEQSELLTELIAALEKATGPDRELDAKIYCFVNGLSLVKFNKNESIQHQPVRDNAGGTYHTMLTPPPHYTASIDAAMTLVPDGDPWTLGQSIYHMHWTAIINEFGPGQTIRSRGSGGSPFPAIALCIASLEARAAMIAHTTTNISLTQLRKETIEECARIAEPWAGFWPTTKTDLAIIKVRKEIAKHIRSIIGGENK